MSGEVIVFIVMGIAFLFIMAMLEMYGHEEKEEASAKSNAETVGKNMVYNNRELTFSPEELKKVG